MTLNADENDATGKTNSGRTACTECSRRKQKANIQQPTLYQLIGCAANFNNSATVIGPAIIAKNGM